MGKFRQFLTVICPQHDNSEVLSFHILFVYGNLTSVLCLSVFSFPDNNLSECQWIFSKLGMWIDIVKIWFGIANGQIWSIFDRVICP